MRLNLTILASCVLIAAAGLPARAGDPAPGDDRAAVIKKIGKPRGHMVMGARETLLYDRGDVELTTGHVARVNLVTPEELAAEEAEREKQAKLAEEARQVRIAEGEKARDELLADPVYRAGPPDEKVAAWEKFRQAHPEVAPPAEYQQVLQAHQATERKVAAAAAALAAKKEEPKPRLSSSKRRKLQRTGPEEESTTPAGP